MNEQFEWHEVGPFISKEKKLERLQKAYERDIQRTVLNILSEPEENETTDLSLM